MKLKDLFRKKTTPVNLQATFKPEPVKRIVPTVMARDKDGNIQEIPYGAILDDLCLIAPDGEYYHQYVGCGFSTEWELVTVEEATKRGYTSCWVCFNKINEAFKEDDYDE